ncbi:MAG: DUF1127 domain-containing protein [Shimia sp.]
MATFTLNTLLHARRAAGLRSMLDAAHSRGQLSRLDAHALEDIGVTREEAMAEATRPLWDVPRNWRR